jgi:hypothetical protein
MKRWMSSGASRRRVQRNGTRKILECLLADVNHYLHRILSFCSSSSGSFDGVVVTVLGLAMEVTVTVSLVTVPTSTRYLPYSDDSDGRFGPSDGIHCQIRVQVGLVGINLRQAVLRLLPYRDQWRGRGPRNNSKYGARQHSGRRKTLHPPPAKLASIHPRTPDVPRRNNLAYCPPFGAITVVR